MQKNDRVAADRLMSAMSAPEVETVIWKGIGITVRPILPLPEMIEFVNSVIEACFDQKRGVYLPEMRDFAFRVNLVSRYARVDLPDSLEDQYTLVYCSGLFDTIYSAVNKGQADAIAEAIGLVMGRL